MKSEVSFFTCFWKISVVFIIFLGIGLMLVFPCVNAVCAWETETKIEPLVRLRSVHMINASDGWAVGANITGHPYAIVLHYNGSTWVQWLDKNSDPPGLAKHSVFMVNSSEGWTSGWGGAMVRYDGSAWKIKNFDVGTMTRNSIYMVNASDGWCVGDQGVTLLYNSSGWFRYLPKPTGRDLFSVYMVNSTEGWIVGWSGTILHYTGGAWNNYTSPTTRPLYSVYMIDVNEGWAVGGGGTILHYTSGTWNKYTSPTSRRLYSVFMINSTEGWAVGEEGSILKMTEVGTQVMNLSAPCGVVIFQVDEGLIEDLTSVPVEATPLEGRPPVNFPCDLFSFNITGLTPGQKVSITVTFPNPVPTDAEYWKYGPTLENPAPHWYQVPLQDNDGDNVIILEFQDGGIGDNDLTADGVIMEPGGIGIPHPPISGELLPNKIANTGRWITLLSIITLGALMALKKGI
jgi:photosystem II stability/assembly factor-like uncharacterized protein